jgi:hypothetical protein
MIAVSSEFAPSSRPSLFRIGLFSTDCSRAAMVFMPASTLPLNGHFLELRQSFR